MSLGLTERLSSAPAEKLDVNAVSASFQRNTPSFEFFDPLLLGHDHFLQPPNLLGQGGVLGLDLGQLPAAGVIRVLQAPMALLENGKLPAQIREIVRPPVVGLAGPLAGYGGRTRHACIIGTGFPVSRHMSSLSLDVWAIGNISPICLFSGAGGIEMVGLADWGT